MCYYFYMLNILWESEKLVAVIKPAGLDSEKDMVNLLSEQLNTVIYPIHRLDRVVGGVMLYGKTRDVCSIDFEKTYLAVVEGILDNKKDTLTDYLYHDRKSNKTFVVKNKRNGVKEAQLEYSVIEEKDDKSLVMIKLKTGRTHQIRVQFASRRHPLVADGKYGSKDNRGTCALYSYSIKTGERVFVHLPPDEYPFNLFNLKGLE